MFPPKKRPSYSCNLKRKRPFENNRELRIHDPPFDAFLINKTEDKVVGPKDYERIPPFAGALVTDKNGYPLLQITKKENPIYKLLSEGGEGSCEIIMFTGLISALRNYAESINFQKESHIVIYTKIIKLQIFFLFEDFNVIVFLNRKTILYSELQKEIIDYFATLLTKYKDLFMSNEYITSPNNEKRLYLEDQGKHRLDRFNSKYIHRFRKGHMELQEILDNVLKRVEPEIQEQLNYYFENVPEDLCVDLSKEIKYKIRKIISSSPLFKPRTN